MYLRSKDSRGSMAAYLFNVFLGGFILSFCFRSAQTGDWDSASIESEWSSEDPLMPCVYSGEVFNHGDTWVVDQDTSCQCDDSEVVCDVMTCPDLDCDKPIDVKGEKCILCQHNVVASRLHVNVRSMDDTLMVDRPFTMNFDLGVVFEEYYQTTGVSGKGLWKVSAWGSPSPDGEGAQHSYQDQILSARQASQAYEKDAPFNINSISLNLVPTNCASFRQVCLSFARGDNPITKSGLDFVFSASIPDTNNVVTCFASPECLEEDRPIPPKTLTETGAARQSCRASGTVYEDGETWQTDECTTCRCNAGRSSCETEECETPQCANPRTVEGQCCRKCPYTVSGRGIGFQLSGSYNFVTGRLSQVIVQMDASFRDKRSTAVEGEYLWKLSGWGSYNNDGSGRRLMFADNLLNDAQSSTPYVPGETFRISGITYNLENYECEQLRFFCFAFAKGDNPSPRFGLPFEVRGFTSSAVTCVNSEQCLPEDMLDVASEYESSIPVPVVTTSLPATTRGQPRGTETDVNQIPTGRDPSEVGRGQTTGNEVTGGDWQPDRGGGAGGGTVGRPQRPDQEFPRGPRPCFTRITEYRHMEKWRMDPCTRCQCNDASIRCVIKSCPPYFCFDPIFREGSCCPICPPNVIVDAVSPTILSAPPKLIIGKMTQVILHVNVSFMETFETTSVSGSDLWKLSVWTSRKPDGGSPQGVLEQALNDRQRMKKHTYGTPIMLRGIRYEFRVSTCPEVRFICVEFGKGEDATTKHDFGFHFSAFPDSSSLLRCVRLPLCGR